MVYEYIVQTPDAGKRLDLFLTGRGLDFSRSQIQKWGEEGGVTVNGQPAKAGYRLKTGEQVVLTPKEPEPILLKPEPIPLVVVFEDPDLLVIDKPAGLVVHPAPGNYSGTLVQALLHLGQDLSTAGGAFRPGIVHRLDKDTSGLLIVAKNDICHQALTRQFQSGLIFKEYQALTWGTPPQRQGIITRPIGRHPVDRKKMAVNEVRGRSALTEWLVLETYPPGINRLQLRIKTGRTHQIRVHCAALGLPILGDPLYGSKKRGSKGLDPDLAAGLASLSRQMLHAGRLAFSHPRTQLRLEFTSPWPADMSQLIDLLKKS
jgi:23S rRNA pseudouridine1911/1915/1917 synthase